MKKEQAIQKVNTKNLSGTVTDTNTVLSQSGKVENQNQSHNTKKVALGPNTKQETKRSRGSALF